MAVVRRHVKGDRSRGRERREQVAEEEPLPDAVAREFDRPPRDSEAAAVPALDAPVRSIKLLSRSIRSNPIAPS